MRQDRSTAYTWLLPWQVRERRFKAARFGRRGLDPEDVAAFLDRVAGDLAAAYNALAAARQENARIVEVARSRGARPARHRAVEHAGRRDERGWR
ncbi:DivIVA domain-containing protein [Plantactinospora sp. GCM10030261]|uniref:DivIVA domain-containing protein n=1 Tax=Plantactinospora sp. GCM10030261 TaxID=3273420 RepID=UPI0036188C80